MCAGKLSNLNNHQPHITPLPQPKNSIQPLQAEIENKENCSLQNNKANILKDHNYTDKGIVTVPSVVQCIEVKSKERAQVFLFIYFFFISFLH